MQAAVERHAGGELGDVQRARLVVVELGERRERVGGAAGGDDVGARLRVRRRERGGVAVADPERLLPLAHGDPEADAPDQLAGRAAQDLRGALGERERPDERQRGAAGRRARVGLVDHARGERVALAGVGVLAVDPHRDGRGGRAGAADHRGARVVGDRAEVVADGGELVGRAGVVARVGVRDHRVDVGVLQQQRAQAGVLERVAEAPHAVAVDVGDRPDRADREVARGVADAHRRARPRRGGGERVERQRGGDEHLAPARVPRARARQPRGDPAAQAGDRQRLGQRQHAPDARLARDRLPSRCVGRVGEDLLDRRRQHGLAAVLADRLGDRAGVLPVAVDRRAREAGADAGAVDRGAGHADEDPRAVVARRVAREDVDDLDVERADVGAADDRVARALHARPQLRERHDRVARQRRARRDAREDGRSEGGGEVAGAHGRRHCSARILV